MNPDVLTEAALGGRPVPAPWVIDCHSHLGAWYNFYTPILALERYVRVMDHVGIRIACVSGMPAIGPDTNQGNEIVSRAIERFPDRFVGYCVVNPHRPEEAEQELNRWRMPLVKLHPSTHAYPMDGPGYEAALEYAERNRCIVLIHVWQGDDPSEPFRLARLAERRPEVIFIAGHSGGTPKGFRECMEIAKAHPNVCLDPTGSRVYSGSIEALVEAVGDERVLWGTDMGFIDPRAQLGRLVFSRLPLESRTKMLGQNMRRLLLKTRLLPEMMRNILTTERE